MRTRSDNHSGIGKDGSRMCILSLLFGKPKNTKDDEQDWIMEEEISMLEEEEED